MDTASNDFDPRTPARSTDPDTSHEAAARAASLVRDQQARVFGALPAGLELGAEQIGTEVNLQAYQVRKRLPELQSLGLVRTTGATRTTRSGRAERIWVRI